MTSDQFIWWLRGYFDSINLTEISGLPKVDVKAIRDTLDRVGPATTPFVPLPPPKFVPPLLFDAIVAQKAGRCHRCGKEQFVGSGHFCLGGYVNA